MEGAYPAMKKINKNAYCCLEKDVHHNNFQIVENAWRKTFFFLNYVIFP